MLIAMAVWDTEENGRTWMTQLTLEALAKTVNFQKHRLIISDNGSCWATQHMYPRYGAIISGIVKNGENIGTANAINNAWRFRVPGEHCVKMDNDAVTLTPGWADAMELVFERLKFIGILGLKRPDLDEWPLSEGDYKSRLTAVPHTKGEPWYIIEEVNHAMGTCQAYNATMLKKFGYLYQPTVYGFDDSLAATRCEELGYQSAFLHGFLVDHVDPGGDEASRLKRESAGRDLDKYFKIMREYQSGVRPVYYDGGFRD